MTNGSTVSWLWFFLVGEIPFWRVRRPLVAPGRARHRSVTAVQGKLHFGDAVKINLPDVAKEVQYFVELRVFEVGFCDKEAVGWALLTHFPPSSQESEKNDSILKSITN